MIVVAYAAVSMLRSAFKAQPAGGGVAAGAAPAPAPARRTACDGRCGAINLSVDPAIACLIIACTEFAVRGRGDPQAAGSAALRGSIRGVRGVAFGGRAARLCSGAVARVDRQPVGFLIDGSRRLACVLASGCCSPMPRQSPSIYTADAGISLAAVAAPMTAVQSPAGWCGATSASRFSWPQLCLPWSNRPVALTDAATIGCGTCGRRAGLPVSRSTVGSQRPHH